MNVMKMMRTRAVHGGPYAVVPIRLGGRRAQIRVFSIAAALAVAFLVAPSSPAGGTPAPSSDSSGDGSGDRSSSRGTDRSQPPAVAESSAPANPLLDTGRQIGRFFAELCELLEKIE